MVCKNIAVSRERSPDLYKESFLLSLLEVKIATKSTNLSKFTHVTNQMCLLRTVRVNRLRLANANVYRTLCIQAP